MTGQAAITAHIEHTNMKLIPTFSYITLNVDHRARKTLLLVKAYLCRDLERWASNDGIGSDTNTCKHTVHTAKTYTVETCLMVDTETQRHAALELLSHVF